MRRLSRLFPIVLALVCLACSDATTERPATTALRADFALIRAQHGDRFGNLVFHGPRTFNETMAGAAAVTIAEVDELVPLGTLEPDAVHVAGVYVQRVVVRPANAATVPVAWREPR